MSEETHGTCSRQTPDAYFAAIKKAFAWQKILQTSGDDSCGGADAQLLKRFAKANPELTNPPGH